ncbi:HNHc domain-containing protein [Mycena kentingensis (nom. inval.)]|nr:HNHc domain-containing protein [Mycena kentingensis (nom. inval.)]
MTKSSQISDLDLAYTAEKTHKSPDLLLDRHYHRPMALYLGKNDYLNHDQRDVTIWSTDHTVQQIDWDDANYATWRKPWTCTIVAGFFAGQPGPLQAAADFTHHDVWTMLEIAVDRAIHETNWSMVLVGPYPQPPGSTKLLGDLDFPVLVTQARQTFANNIEHQIIHLPPRRRVAGEPEDPTFRPGQYFFFWIDGQGALRNARPEIQTTSLTSRRLTAAATQAQSRAGTEKETRNNELRELVRERDQRCRISGEKVPVRSRGKNMVAFNVAHIFPFAWLPSVRDIVTNNEAALDDLEDSYRAHGRWKGEIMSLGDTPRNAMLMKAELHAYFDDYQFGYITKRDGERIAVRFERNGAPRFSGGLTLFPPLNPSNTDAINVAILDEHFKTGVLWHVAGCGRPKGQ